MTYHTIRVIDLIEKRRWRIVNDSNDPSWTEHFAELANEVRMLPVYVHRNGETEAPVIPGGYWFKGACSTHQYPVAHMVDLSGGLIFIDSEPHKPSAFVGQWWGPVIPPWEEVNQS